MADRRLAILTYHRVLEAPDALRPEAIAKTEFAAQMRWLQRLFTVLPLSSAIERLSAGTLPRRAVAITFDDGYADNAEIALPILRDCGLSACFFIATAYLDGGRMWNDTIIEALRCAPQGTHDLRPLGLGLHELHDTSSRARAIAAIIGKLKYQDAAQRTANAGKIAQLSEVPLPATLMMSTRQVRALADAGMELGGHTHTHPILARVSDAGAETDIREGKQRLEALLESELRLFAYPNGRPGVDYAARHVDMVRRCGFAAAVSTAWGTADRADDRYQLPRVGAGTGGGVMFVARLLRRYGERMQAAEEAAADNGIALSPP